MAERLSMVVSVQAKRKLERLAQHHGATQRAVLEQLHAEAEAASTALDAMTDDARRAYYAGGRLTR